jgi:hypothetical protein
VTQGTARLMAPGERPSAFSEAMREGVGVHDACNLRPLTLRL